MPSVLTVLGAFAIVLGLMFLGLAIFHVGKKPKHKFRDTSGWGQSRPYDY